MPKYYSIAMVLSRGDFFPLETSGNVYRLFDYHKWGTVTSIWWTESRDAAQHSIMHRATPPPPQQRIIHSKILIMLRLINPVLEGEQDKFLHSWGLHSSGRDKQGKQI